MRIPNLSALDLEVKRFLRTDALLRSAVLGGNGIVTQDACVCAGCIEGAMACECCNWRGCRTEIKPC